MPTKWGKLDKDKNFGDLPDVAEAQSNLGLPTFAVALSPTADTTLTQLAGNPGGPQRALFILTQPSEEDSPDGTYSVVWPKPGTPTLAAPAVYWGEGDNGAASEIYDSVNVYELVTADGIHWYGRTIGAGMA